MTTVTSLSSIPKEGGILKPAVILSPGAYSSLVTPLNSTSGIITPVTGSTLSTAGSTALRFSAVTPSPKILRMLSSYPVTAPSAAPLNPVPEAPESFCGISLRTAPIFLSSPAIASRLTCTTA